MKIALLYSPLEENLVKCFKRIMNSFKADIIDYRYPAMILDQYNNFYKFISKDNFSKNDRIIEIIDKNKIQTTLELAICFDYNLFLHIKNMLYKEKCYYYGAMNNSEVIQSMHNKVKTIESSMMLNNIQEVYVAPKVEYDLIIKSPYSNINDFILGNSNHDFQVTAEYSFF